MAPGDSVTASIGRNILYMVISKIIGAIGWFAVPMITALCAKLWAYIGTKIRGKAK